jgi:hypothetical protein
VLKKISAKIINLKIIKVRTPSKMEKIIVSIAFKKALGDLLNYSKNAIGESIALFKNDKKIQEMYEQIHNVGKVRTLWQIDKRVSLDDFFCKPYILIDSTRKKFTGLHILKNESNATNFVIRGIAGQGKSILLRHICIRNLEQKERNRIPVFVQLRRISNKRSLIDCIFNEFKNIGLTINKSIFEYYAKSSKILLLLDGYDEIDPLLSSEVTYDLEQLAQEYKNLNIIVTTRPNSSSGIEMSNQYKLVELENLKEDEYIEYIKKLVSNKKHEYKELLLSKLRRNKRLKETLKTPLMITILVVTYKSHQYIPPQITQFYDELFPVLYQRHDGTKPGFERVTKSKLNHYDAHKVMSAFCCVIKKYNKVGYTESEVHTIAKKALKHTCGNLNVKPDLFIEDISRITGLLIRDGLEYKFIHKSIQEYFTAKYLNSLSRNKLKILLEKNYLANFMTFERELDFISEMNRLRLLSEIIKPTLSNLSYDFGQPIEQMFIKAPDLLKKDIREKKTIRNFQKIHTELSELIIKIQNLKVIQKFVFQIEKPTNKNGFITKLINRLNEEKRDYFLNHLDNTVHNFTRKLDSVAFYIGKSIKNQETHDEKFYRDMVLVKQNLLQNEYMQNKFERFSISNKIKKTIAYMGKMVDREITIIEDPKALNDLLND